MTKKSNIQRAKKRWTDEERYILKKYYRSLSMEELLEKLPDRTIQSIYSQVHYLEKRGWTFL